jgi:hypothetical protein
MPLTHEPTAEPKVGVLVEKQMSDLSQKSLYIRLLSNQVRVLSG